MRLYTKISEAFWCDSNGEFKSASIPKMQLFEEGPKEIFWLDKLFEGGIFIPKELPKKNRALTILLTGPPGTGKSTLAMELCNKWTDAYILEKNAENIYEKKTRGFSSIYITSETDEIWETQKARSFKWITNGGSEKDNKRTSKKDLKIVKIWQTTEFIEYIQQENELAGVSPDLIDAFVGFFSPRKLKISPLAMAIKKKWKKELIKKKIKEHNPSILAIDSLNTFEPSKRPEIFKRFMSLINSGPMIILLVLEAGAEAHSSDFWSYTADIVIRLDKKILSDYLVRTIEIVKARYQPHIWGTHQLKIYTPSNFPELPTHRKDMSEDEKNELIKERKKIIQEKKRAHPYHKAGGIFIFPSIHYYLSVYKRSRPQTEKPEYKPPLRSLEAIFTEGFPRGRCIGFIGMRGGHKSHLAYLTLLKTIVNDPDERALVVSLRDDEGMARKTIEKILANETDSVYTLDNLIDNDKIEIMYSPPGYITPEEFFHRMLLSVQRLKSHSLETKVSVLFNSLDQLSSRFPLCAREQIFIPGIIATLSAEGVTSFFIAVEEPGQPPEQYGLMSMADALISFRRERFNQRDYIGHICSYMNIKSTNKKIKEIANSLPNIQQIVTMRIVRFAGGQAAGAGGMLELIHQKDAKSRLFHNMLSEKNINKNKPKGAQEQREGLVFVPFSHKYHQEECILNRGDFEEFIEAINRNEDKGDLKQKKSC